MLSRLTRSDYINNMLRVLYRCFTLIFLLSSSLLLSACVVTGQSTTSKVDLSKAHDAHVNLGLTYLNNDNRASSRRHFDKALAIDSDSPQANAGLALLYQRIGEFELAEESFTKALNEDSGFTKARVDYGRFLYEQERYSDAYKVFELAAKDIASPSRALALTHLGQTALKLGNAKKARFSFEHALNLDNKLTLPMIELGELYFADGNYTDAKRYLDQYIGREGRTPKALWLGIRIERIFGNKDREASYVLALKNLHPYSQEYLLYKQALKNQ